MKTRDRELLVYLICILVLTGLVVFAIVHAVATNCEYNACGH
jgi:hypothetical protein